jgi:streptomycin 6-kinase
VKEAGVPDLPPAFLAFNAGDPGWLAALPELLEHLADRWSLRLGPHFPGIRINYVAAAARSDGTHCVLKVSRILKETASEIAALRLWDGDGAARLLEADPSVGALVLERLEPGTMLREVARNDDEAATRVAADVLDRLWRTAPSESGLRPLADWCAAYDRNRVRLRRGDRGFPADLFRRADALRAGLLSSTPEQTVLHGDLHHDNVLRSEGRGWRAIDPKGLVGDRHFDVCMFLRNPWPEGPGLEANRRRLDVFCERLGLDRARARDWCIVHAVLDACWDFEDGNRWDGAIAYAEQTLGL